MRRCCLMACLVLVLGSGLISVARSQSPGLIWGMDSWFAVGDTLQFLGDAQTSAPGDAGCGVWDADCLIDKGCAFRPVDHVNVEACSWGGYDTACYTVSLLCDPDEDRINTEECTTMHNWH